VKFTADSWWRPRSHVLRVGNVDLWIERLDARSARLIAYVRQRALHLDAQAAYKEAYDLVQRIGGALCQEPGFSAAGVPTLLGFTPFADVVGWRLERRAVRRFHSRLGKRFKGWDDLGTSFESVQHAKFFRCYDKTLQIQLYPSAAYVMDVWKQRCGYRPSMGPVWRVEFSWRGPRLHSLQPMDVGVAWRTSLETVRLTASSPANRKKPLRDRDDSRLWKLLHATPVAGPWETAPTAASPVTVSRERRVSQARGTLASSLGVLIGDPALEEDLIVPVAETHVHLLMGDPAFVAKLKAAVRRP
jgi:hypothetical protein